MKQSRARASHRSDGNGWLAGRRAWSLVRTVAVIESDSIVRRTLRESRESRSASRLPIDDTPEGQMFSGDATAVPETPETIRFRAKLMDGPHELAVQGAGRLLELAEPESLGEARRTAFPSGASTPEAELALAEAWEQFRHDRYRALN